jgi:hypothetical protein
MYLFATVVVTGLLVLGTATSLPCPGQEPLALPEGVTHVALPPGALKIERIFRNKKPLLRLSVDKTVIEGRSLFLGDGKNALEYEATKEGVHHVSRTRPKGFVIDGVEVNEPGSTLGALGGNFITVDQLKPGSVYLTTPSIKFEFKP